MYEVYLPHSTKKCYHTKYNCISCLPYQCRANGTNCEPFPSCHTTNPEQTPRIGKRTSQIPKNTSQSNPRDESKNILITWLEFPKTRHRQVLNNGKNKSIEYNCDKSEKNDFFGNFPTVHLSKNITKNIREWKKNCPCIERKTSKLSHLRGSNIWYHENHAEETNEDGEAKGRSGGDRLSWFHIFDRLVGWPRSWIKFRMTEINSFLFLSLSLFLFLLKL